MKIVMVDVRGGCVVCWPHCVLAWPYKTGGRDIYWRVGVGSCGCGRLELGVLGC